MKKRFFTSIILLLAVLQPAVAQLTTEEYKEKYDRQVRAVGYAGLGVETILDRWESVYPEDTDMLEGRFFFDLTRARTTRMHRSPKPKYMGKKPLLALKDSTGAPVYFFEEEFYDDSLFLRAMGFLERAVALKPEEFQFRAHQINSLMGKEKEMPVLSVEELDALISYDHARHPQWTFRGEAAKENFFPSVVQEYCRLYFEIGSPASYAAFRRISERMYKLYPDHPEFLSNMASYWQVAENNPKKAQAVLKKVSRLKTKSK